MILWVGSFHKLLDYFHQKSIYLQNMRYKYLTIALMSGVLFAQGKISLESVLDGTFSTESIGRYDWKNSSDSYYFSEKSDEGLEFYEYNLASNDTLKAFSVKKKYN